MPASLDDILTTQKNGVVGINGIGQIWLRGQGTVTTSTVDADTFIIRGRGYLVSFSVTVAGTTTGAIHNAASVAGASAANALCAVPNTIGVYKCGLVYNTGLVIKVGTGQSINITYTPG